MDGGVHRKRDRCRLCDRPEVELAVPMRPTPIADAYVPPTEANRPQPLYPLDLYLCRACGHVQLLDIIDPELLFGTYIYSTGISLGLREHFRTEADMLVSRFSVPTGSLVVDIGSNDGTLLSFFQAHGMRVIGVDPAKEIARRATENGFETIAAFFTPEVGSKIREKYGEAQVITANNVFAHVDDLASVVRAIGALLAPSGVFVFEVSYLMDILDKILFDTIYHEHLCYHSVRPLSRFFRRHGIELFDVERIGSKGGSLRGFAQRIGGPRWETASLRNLLAVEQERGLHSPSAFAAFVAAIQARRHKLHHLLDEMDLDSRSLAGFGASATVTTLLYQFELEKRLAFLVDDNARRHGLLSPGCHLPVLSPQALHKRRPAGVVILAWNYAAPIMKRHASYRDQGGRFILPMPAPRVV